MQNMLGPNVLSPQVWDRLPVADRDAVTETILRVLTEEV
jgi:hypothetical protein